MEKEICKIIELDVDNFVMCPRQVEEKINETVIYDGQEKYNILIGGKWIIFNHDDKFSIETRNGILTFDNTKDFVNYISKSMGLKYEHNR